MVLSSHPLLKKTAVSISRMKRQTGANNTARVGNSVFQGSRERGGEEGDWEEVEEVDRERGEHRTK